MQPTDQLTVRTTVVTAENSGWTYTTVIADAEEQLDTVPNRESAELRWVAEDELEGGRRAILNYGHTIGHALEAAAGYAFPHGSAVAVGMVAEAEISRRRFGTDLAALHDELLLSAGLPRRASGVDVEASLGAMTRDKKRTVSGTEAEHRFVLLEDVGRPVYGVTVADAEVRRAVEIVTR